MRAMSAASHRSTGIALAAAALLAGCGGGGDGRPDQFLFGTDERPVYLEVPADYDNSAPTALLMVLHGYSANAYTQLAYTGLEALVEDQGILLVAPEGTVNSTGQQFWNATDACCDNDGSGVDDVAYLTDLIDDISSVWNVDPARVYLFGHSNGGYMSYRMACDTDRIAALISLAGATWKDTAMCDPAAAVSVLQIHGTADDLVLYAGDGDGPGASPGAVETVTDWAGYDGCTGELALRDAALDIDSVIPGAETEVSAFAGCPAGLGVELWTITGGGHIPPLHPDFATTVWSWLDAHPRP